ncbi:hypothetical protein [Alteraurantiacibacter palmitatis]|uniref:Flagellar hook-length control protein FliK n=1 Tax=Alteraurantiacibacter palmitatis TaxID=2054628 RepID=A0ABV7E2S2_9SPHN
MALAQRLEIADHEARLAAGNFTDGPYGSLLGGRMGRPKKKPVLVLDPDELAEAQVAMAMGGARIMEEAGDPLAAERRPVPSMLLGLAPIDAEDEWEPEAALVPAADMAVAEDGEEAAADEEWADEAQPDTGPFAGLTSSAPWRDADEADSMAPDAASAEAAIPSIEEQLARMRHLTAPRVPPVQPPLAAAAPPVPSAYEPEPQVEPEPEPEPEAILPAPTMPESPRTSPVERASSIERLGDMWPPVAPPPAMSAPTSLPDPGIAWEEPEAAEADGADMEEPVFDLPIKAMLGDAAPAMAPASFPMDDMAHAADGPDLAWMMPKEPRQLHIEEGAHNSLRARLLREEAEAAEDISPSLWDRLRHWLAGLVSRR